MKRRHLAALVVVCCAACGKDGALTQPTPMVATPTSSMSAVARNYLDQLITLMQNNSIKRLTIDWNAFRTEVYDAARDAQTIADTLPAIRVAIARIGDIGLATCGLSTSNSTFTLSDGAVLTLTTALMADRSRQAYGDRITPDELIPERDQLLPRAVAWLQTGR